MTNSRNILQRLKGNQKLLEMMAIAINTITSLATGAGNGVLLSWLFDFDLVESIA